ncbi:MAG: hypothetical protein K9H84_03855 [Bacteroidales bacterium]|nr:hypothetical protein [Bacteroidales bacterium]
MLKRIVIITTVLFFAIAIKAQDNNSESVSETDPQENSNIFRGKSQLIQGGLSLGHFGYGYYGSRTGLSLPVTLAY